MLCRVKVDPQGLPQLMLFVSLHSREQTGHVTVGPYIVVLKTLDPLTCVLIHRFWKVMSMLS